jgi:hypothetical protein
MPTFLKTVTKSAYQQSLDELCHVVACPDEAFTNLLKEIHATYWHAGARHNPFSVTPWLDEEELDEKYALLKKNIPKIQDFSKVFGLFEFHCKVGLGKKRAAAWRVETKCRALFAAARDHVLGLKAFGITQVQHAQQHVKDALSRIAATTYEGRIPRKVALAKRFKNNDVNAYHVSDYHKKGLLTLQELDIIHSCFKYDKIC